MSKLLGYQIDVLSLHTGAHGDRFIDPHDQCENWQLHSCRR